MEIRFVSSNAHKIAETVLLLEGTGITLIPASRKIEELQTQDLRKLVKDKLLKAFTKIGKPLIVEHTGLYVDYLDGFPGGLTELFWNSLQADKFSLMLGNLPDKTATAKTCIGYCDGKQVYFFEGEIKGSIAGSPCGNRDFQWDCVFVPDGYSQTFAEMGHEKDKISMRKLAYDQFKKFIQA